MSIFLFITLYASICGILLLVSLGSRFAVRYLSVQAEPAPLLEYLSRLTLICILASVLLLTSGHVSAVLHPIGQPTLETVQAVDSWFCIVALEICTFVLAWLLGCSLPCAKGNEPAHTADTYAPVIHATIICSIAIFVLTCWAFLGKNLSNSEVCVAAVDIGICWDIHLLLRTCITVLFWLWGKAERSKRAVQSADMEEYG